MSIPNGCTLAAQGPAGCEQTAWRLEPGGYLRHILNARVYDIAVRPPADSNMTLLQFTGSPVFIQTISAALTKA